MYWQESDRPDGSKIAPCMVDIAFRMQCPCLPADHSWPLFKAIEKYLPWFPDEQNTGIHAIHGAESNNGWQRPSEVGGGIIHLSKRVRLVLRIPSERLDQCAAMSGKTLKIAGTTIELGSYSLRAIKPTSTLLARRVVTRTNEDETGFLDRVNNELAHLNVTVPKLLPGRMSGITTPDGLLEVRRLLLADLRVEDSIRVQESGLGEGRILGCGLFVPHKSIAPVKQYTS